MCSLRATCALTAASPHKEPKTRANEPAVTSESPIDHRIKSGWTPISAAERLPRFRMGIASRSHEVRGSREALRRAAAERSADSDFGPSAPPPFLQSLTCGYLRVRAAWSRHSLPIVCARLRTSALVSAHERTSAMSCIWSTRGEKPASPAGPSLPRRALRRGAANLTMLAALRERA
jgi:hypothetical protein